MTQSKLERRTLYLGALAFAAGFMIPLNSEEKEGEIEDTPVKEDFKIIKTKKSQGKVVYSSPLEESAANDELEPIFKNSFRYDYYFQAAGKYMDISSDLLGGIAMTESNGSPLIVNLRSGAAGLMQFMSGTAKNLGLKVFQDAGFTIASHRKSNHVRNLLYILSVNNCSPRNQELNCDYEKISRIDERFDPKASIYAAARFLSDMDKRCRKYNLGFCQDRAIDYYHRGEAAMNRRSSPDPRVKRYVRKVRRNQQYYSDRRNEILLRRER